MVDSLDVRWIAAQIGAREHYAVPRGMARAGSLRRLYTDVWWDSTRQFLRHGPPVARRLAGRCTTEIPTQQVTAFTWRSIWDRLNWRREDIYGRCLRGGSAFADRVLRHLRREDLDAHADAYFGYASASLELLSFFEQRGHLTVLDQMDPGNDEDLIAAERRSWRGWEEASWHRPDAYYDRVAREWKLARFVLVNSRWSRSSLLKQGVPEEKIMVVPLAYEPTSPQPPTRPPRSGPLRVLWLGSVTLRKGIPYLLEAARIIQDRPVQIRVVGGVHIDHKFVDRAPPNVQFCGPCPRGEISKEYGQADVFVLPTVSDGFAITQLEAMYHGLPVITTPHCGDVVAHGNDGFIVPAREAEPIAGALRELDSDRRLLADMSERARLRSREFSIQAVYSAFRRELARVSPKPAS